jgi:hypothetical protein
MTFSTPPSPRGVPIGSLRASPRRCQRNHHATPVVASKPSGIEAVPGSIRRVNADDERFFDFFYPRDRMDQCSCTSDTVTRIPFLTSGLSRHSASPAVQSFRRSTSGTLTFRFCRELASDAGVTMRELDRAMWQWSNERA